MKKIVHYLILAAVLVGLPLGCAWVAGYDAMLADVAEIAPQSGFPSSLSCLLS